jgi:hypothetical protein
MLANIIGKERFILLCATVQSAIFDFKMVQSYMYLFFFAASKVSTTFFTSCERPFLQISKVSLVSTIIKSFNPTTATSFFGL